MSTLEVALARIAALEARVSALESGGAPSSSSASGSRSSGGIPQVEPLNDAQLDKAWADKRISKDPKNWKGRTQVGRRYSNAPPEWLLSMAGFFEWKAQKGREEVPVRTRDDGKPWHESDTFEAKLLRAWARRNANKPAPAPSPPKDDFGDPGGPDDFNFGANAKPKTPSDDDIGF